MMHANQKEFKTPKGTLLPLLSLKGKDYLQVAHRLVWFREEKSDWRVETEFTQLTDGYALAKATIRDQQNQIVATAHKREDQKHFADFIEKAETGAIGRALALIGYGTQFAPELDEENRVVDAPLVAPSLPAKKEKALRAEAAMKAAIASVEKEVKKLSPGSSVDQVDCSDVVPIAGKLAGRRLGEYELETLRKYLADMKKAMAEKGLDPTHLAPETKHIYEMVSKEINKRMLVK